jgi:hypothetical protein
VCDGELRTDAYCCSGQWQMTACSRPDYILWTDSLQTGSFPFGFDGWEVEYPGDNPIEPDDDANGASLTRVPNPLSGGGFAMRHFGTFDAEGARAQAGIWSFENEAFARQAMSPEGVWIAQEWYFPEAVDAGGDDVPWLSVWDWHSTDDGGGDRWHTSPGLMIHEDGSMRVRWEWGGAAGEINPESAYSTIAMPVGEWFDVEMHYVWSSGPTTLTLWINGELALEQSGVQTRASGHSVVETYIKWYGSTQGATDWNPTPTIRYTRNVRIASERIWRAR